MEPLLCLSASESLFQVGQRRDDDVAHDLRAALADVIEVVATRHVVPLRIIEIDDVHRGNAGLEKRPVVVFDARVQIEKDPAVADRLAVAQITSFIQAADLSSRRIWKIAIPIMSTSSIPLMCLTAPAFWAAATQYRLP